MAIWVWNSCFSLRKCPQILCRHHRYHFHHWTTEPIEICPTRRRATIHQAIPTSKTFLYMSKTWPTYVDNMMTESIYRKRWMDVTFLAWAARAFNDLLSDIWLRAKRPTLEAWLIYLPKYVLRSRLWAQWTWMSRPLAKLLLFLECRTLLLSNARTVRCAPIGSYHTGIPSSLPTLTNWSE